VPEPESLVHLIYFWKTALMYFKIVMSHFRPSFPIHGCFEGNDDVLGLLDVLHSALDVWLVAASLDS
jgi:hypothetical protein